MSQKTQHNRECKQTRRSVPFILSCLVLVMCVILHTAALGKVNAAVAASGFTDGIFKQIAVKTPGNKLDTLPVKMHRFAVYGDLSGLNSEALPEGITYPIKRLYAYYMTGGRSAPDTIEVHEGKYEWTGQIEGAEKINLMVANSEQTTAAGPGGMAKRPMKIPSVILFIQPGTMRVEHRDDFENVKLKGSLADDQFRALQEEISRLSAPLDEQMEILGRQRQAAEAALNDSSAALERSSSNLQQERGGADVAGHKLLDSIRIRTVELNEKKMAVQDQVYKDFLDDPHYVNSPIRLYVIRELGGGYSIEAAKIEDYFDALPEPVRSSGKGKQLKKEMEWSKVMHLLEQDNSSQAIAAYITANPHSPVALDALQQYAGPYLDPGQVRPLFELLPVSIRSSPEGRAFNDRLEIAEKTGIGQIAPLFTQKDTAGVDLSLESLRGQYVLVDFWASWCVPCRAESPNLVKAYRQFKDRGFTILGVALEQPGAEKAWLKAIHKDSLYWHHVSDLKFWQNQVAILYGVSAVPQNFLIDPEGKIIAKNLFGERLLKKLSGLLGGEGPL